MGTPIDRNKLLSVGVIGTRSRPKTKEFRRTDGVRCKAVTDELGNTQTWHNTGDTERLDARIKAPEIKVTSTSNEVRQE